MRFCPRIYERENFSINRRSKNGSKQRKAPLLSGIGEPDGAGLARRLNVEQSEADKLLAGERVGYDTARKFVYYFRGVIAQHYIDWDATEAENPLAEETEDSYTKEESEIEGEDAA